MPTTTFGRWAAGVAAAAALSLVIFPLITMRYRETYPLVDSWVMPTLIAAMVNAAGILSVLAVWLRHERSRLSILVLVLTVLGALLSATVVIGGAIAGGS